MENDPIMMTDCAALVTDPALALALREGNKRRLRRRAAELTGYDPSPAGQIRFAA